MTSTRRRIAACVALGILWASIGGAASGRAAEAQATPAAGQSSGPPAPGEAPDPKVVELAAAWDEAARVAIKGPGTAPLLNQATLTVPEGMVFVPGPQAARILHAYGNVFDEPPLGLVTGRDGPTAWIAVIRFVKEGYIKDDDAKDWNADELLAGMKAGTEAGNEERVRRGFPKHHVIGWIEKPTYDAAGHRLIWSMASRSEDDAPDADHTVNYNTYALGREGYISLNLVTDERRIEGDKPVARTLLANIAYLSGKRYEDFNVATDRIAAYGLAALVGGVAAKKLGLFAVALAFLAKFAKVGILAVAGLGAAFAKLFRRKA